MSYTAKAATMKWATEPDAHKLPENSEFEKLRMNTIEIHPNRGFVHITIIACLTATKHIPSHKAPPITPVAINASRGRL